MKPLRVLMLSDGRPGHYHLSEGIIAAVGRLRPIAVERIEVRRTRLASPGMIWQMNRWFTPSHVLRAVYGLDAGMLSTPDLIVSAGGDTLAANICLARTSGALNIFYGSLRRYDPSLFSLVLTSYSAKAVAPNTVMTLKPSARDPDGTAMPPLPAQQLSIAGVLIGGDAGTFRYCDEDWTQLLTFLEAGAAGTPWRWMVSNSPRTPAALSDRLALLAERPGAPIVEFIDVRRAGTGTLDRLFANSRAVLCTADSSSMLSEAIWMRRPAIALFPKAWTLPPDELAYRRHLEANGWSRSLGLTDLTLERFESTLRDVHPLGQNPLEELSRLIGARLPQLVR